MSSQRIFIIVGHTVVPDSNFSLNDLPGTGGRIDILARSVNSSFMLSHGIRKNVSVYLVMAGGVKDKKPSVIVEFSGSELKYMNPDERNIASLIKIALKDISVFRGRYSTPGIYCYRGGLSDILKECKRNGKNIYYLHEKGDLFSDYKSNSAHDFSQAVFVLGDRDDLTEEEESFVLSYGGKKLSLGDISYHADHCITVMNYLLDGMETI